VRGSAARRPETGCVSELKKDKNNEEARSQNTRIAASSAVSSENPAVGPSFAVLPFPASGHSMQFPTNRSRIMNLAMARQQLDSKNISIAERGMMRGAW
jgi:hypothetical protein